MYRLKPINPKGAEELNIKGQIKYYTRLNSSVKEGYSIGELSDLPLNYVNSLNGDILSLSRIGPITSGYTPNPSEYEVVYSMKQRLKQELYSIYNINLDFEIIEEKPSEQTYDNANISTENPAPGKRTILTFNIETPGKLISEGDTYTIEQSTTDNYETFIFSDNTANDIPSEYTENPYEGAPESATKPDDYYPSQEELTQSSVNETGLSDNIVYPIPTPGQKTLSSRGLEVLKRHEGVINYIYDDARGKTPRPSSYSDCKGYPTIGIGHLIQNKERTTFANYFYPNVMTDNQVNNLFMSDIQSRIKTLNNLIKVDCSQGQFDALFCLMYNTGSGNSFFKRAVSKLNSGDIRGAANEIKSGPTTSKGKVLPGLIARRKEESELFLT